MCDIQYADCSPICKINKRNYLREELCLHEIFYSLFFRLFFKKPAKRFEDAARSKNFVNLKFIVLRTVSQGDCRRNPIFLLPFDVYVIPKAYISWKDLLGFKRKVSSWFRCAGKQLDVSLHLSRCSATNTARQEKINLLIATLANLVCLAATFCGIGFMFRLPVGGSVFLAVTI